MAEKEKVTQVVFNEIEESLRKFYARREEIKKDLEYARSLGDLSENSDYDAARIAQSENESKIKDLENRLNNCEVVEESEIETDKVNINTFVTYLNLKDNKQYTYCIVQPKAAKLAEGRISCESPIGSALLNHRVGDKVTVDCKNKFDAEILNISSSK